MEIILQNLKWLPSCTFWSAYAIGWSKFRLYLRYIPMYLRTDIYVLLNGWSRMKKSRSFFLSFFLLSTILTKINFLKKTRIARNWQFQEKSSGKNRIYVLIRIFSPSYLQKRQWKIATNHIIRELFRQHLVGVFWSKCDWLLFTVIGAAFRVFTRFNFVQILYIWNT